MKHVAVQLDFVLSAAWGALVWGKDKGYYAEQGIDLEIVPGQGTDDALNAINAGTVDFAFVDNGNYVEQRISGDTETTAVYVLVNISTTGIISIGTPIVNPSDMAGKTFGTVPFSSGKEKIPDILKANGVNYPGVGEPGTLIELMDFGVLYPTLFQGDIDTAEAGLSGSWESAFVSARDQGLTAYFKPISDWGYKDYSKMLIVRDALIASDPGLVGRLVAATYKSQLDAFANASGDEIFDILVKIDPQTEKERTNLIWKSETTFVKNPGPIDGSVLQYQLDRLKTQGTDTKGIKPEDLFTNKFIPTT